MRGNCATVKRLKVIYYISGMTVITFSALRDRYIILENNKYNSDLCQKWYERPGKNGSNLGTEIEELV